MKIINLVENTEGKSGCGTEHGLCFYIETEQHKLLMDTGASALFAENAKKKGVDLTKVDTVVLSHGHYDHGGGLLAFADLNPKARIYMQDTASGAYYSMHREPRYIGLAPEVGELPGLISIQGDYQIDEELSLFANIPFRIPMPATNERLKIKQGVEFIQDDFRHEQCLVIRQNGQYVLMSGCAHHGILNILMHYRWLYGSDPDYVFSGFHLMKKKGYSNEDMEDMIRTAEELKSFHTVFYTGHCTGEEPYEVMKQVLGEQLWYVHCGDEVDLG